MISSQNKEIQALVNDIRDGRLLLPELQRRYVWKSTQVRDLFDSLYHQYPSGQILVWETDDLPFSHTVSLEGVKSDQKRPQLLLDGQQRITSLAAIMLGRPLLVKNSKFPIDIVFNIYTEKFEVAGPRQSKEAGWVSLSKLYTDGVFGILTDLNLSGATTESQKIFDRLNRLEKIKTYNYQVNILEKLSYEEVTHIFVRINSGGTKLGTADLALAQMSSRWRGVTQEMSNLQDYVYKKHHMWMDTGIMVRVLSALVSGQTRPAYLFRGERQKITVVELEAAWQRLKVSMDLALSFLVSNCDIDRLDLLPTQYILIPLTAFFDRFGDQVTDRQARDLQRWVYMALIWMRYSSAAETAADQDIVAVNSDEPAHNLVQNVEDKVGKRRPVTERELRDQRKNSPFMMMSYVLAKQAFAQDWFTGVRIGGSQTLEFHHIFPKDVLREKYDLKADSRTVDQVANLAFLSKRANIKIRSQSPSAYLPTIPEHRLKSQCVPHNTNLWELDQFENFVLERRTLLADAINQLLQRLTDEATLYVMGDIQLLESRINALEWQLRDLIVARLFENDPEEGWTFLPFDLRSGLESRLKKHLEQSPYHAEKYQTPASKLEFCQFSDYGKIILANWPYFVDTFGKKEIFSSHNQNVVNARNALKHSREISRSDQALAEAGLIWLEDCLRAAIINGEEVVENDEFSEEEQVVSS